MFFLFFAGEAFDAEFASQRRGFIGQLLDVHQPDGTPVPGVACTAAEVVLALAPLRVGGPAGVEGPVGTFQDITEISHGL